MIQSNVLLSLSHLNKSFGSVQAVQDLSLDVYAGEIFGFLGPNGAGKTTTISILCGLLRADSGSVTLAGAATQDAMRRCIGVCPQSLVLWERLTCLEQLEMIGEMYDVPRAEARRRGLRLLDVLGLTEKRDRLAATLSGGMQRRLNLALALVHDPVLLVLDEPEAGLDPQSRVLVREYIRGWAREKPGRTVIFTTHNMDEADRLVDRLAIIDHGRLLVLDTAEALKRRCAEGDVLEIRLKPLDGPAQAIPAALGDMASFARSTEDVLEIRHPEVVEILSTILERLRRAGYTPAEVHLRENTLEDVFISLTGRSLRE